MQFTNTDTIAAVATPPGNGGVGIVRISGTDLLTFAQTITAKKQIQPRRAYFSNFYGTDQEILDSGILLYFTAPASFTGEDVVELQAHGGTVVLQLLLHRCLQLGARAALPGEFSYRAFRNNKIDLVQAESIADLIAAASANAVKMAGRSLQGDFSQAVTRITKELIKIRVSVEASLDFPEEDPDNIPGQELKHNLITIREHLEKLLAAAKQGALLRDGIQITLIGAPNVGKSSLLNRLAQNEVAIVTDIAGTTRDPVREKILINDIPVQFIDTAGLRESTDTIETIGIKKSRVSAQEADIALILIDPREGINKVTETVISGLDPTVKLLYVYNKIDLYPQGLPVKPLMVKEPVLYISVQENQGIDLLKTTILAAINYHPENNNLFLARSRHINALIQTLSEIVLALDHYNFLDLTAEHLKNAQLYLNELTGVYSADDLLGEIFSNFCLGK